MADVTIVAADIRPLKGCVVKRFAAGGTLTPGQPVYLSAANTVSAADGSAVATAACIGVVIAGPDGAVSFSAGDQVDVVLYGPVAGYSTNMGYGTYFYVDDDAGVIADAAGTKSTIIGIGLDSTTLLVRPQVVSLA